MKSSKAASPVPVATWQVHFCRCINPSSSLPSSSSSLPTSPPGSPRVLNMSVRGTGWPVRDRHRQRARRRCSQRARLLSRRSFKIPRPQRDARRVSIIQTALQTDTGNNLSKASLGYKAVTNPYEEVRLAHSLKRTVGRRFRFSPSQSSFLPPSPLSIMICTAAERIGLIWR